MKGSVVRKKKHAQTTEPYTTSARKQPDEHNQSLDHLGSTVSMYTQQLTLGPSSNGSTTEPMQEEHSDAPSLHVQWTPSTALLKLQDIFGLEPTDTDPYGIEAAHELTEKLVLKRFFLPYAYLPLKQLNSGMEAWLVYMHKTELEQYVLTLDTLPHSVYVDFTSQTGEFRKELSSFLWKRVEIECFVKTSKINLKLYTLLRAVQEPTLEHLEQLVLSKWIAIMRMNTYTKWTSMSSDSGERNEKNILYCYETPYDYLLNWIDYWLPRSEIAHWRRHFTQQKKKFLEEMY